MEGITRVVYRGGRTKIGMEGITKRVGRQAGYCKSRDGGREGVEGREGGVENITNERIENRYISYRCISNIYDVMA